MEERKILKLKWKDLEIAAWLGWTFNLQFELCGYFDNRPVIHLGLIYVTIMIHLPFRNSWTDECDPPTWGIAIHNNTFWIYRGGKGNMNGGNKWWTFYMPWSWQWYRTSLMVINDKLWINEYRGKKHRLDFWREDWDKIMWKEVHPYTYVLNSGEVQHVNATIHVKEREWRMHWLMWVPFIKRVIRAVEVNFDAEVGEGTGTFKGGTIGCNYAMLPGEKPVDTLKRMERDRKFT